MHWSASPWNEITRLPVGSLVQFWCTFEPHNPQNDHCDYHGKEVQKCRHIVLKAHGTEFRTNVCMEEARLYFVKVDVEEESKSPTWP